MSDARRKSPVNAAESEALRMRGNSLHGNREIVPRSLEKEDNPHEVS